MSGSFIAAFVCSLLIPLVLIVGGYMMEKHPPKKINRDYGYRTRLSMKNKETWVFAHQICGKLWFRLGWPLLILSALVQLPFARAEENAIGILTVALEAGKAAVLLLSVPVVERALKRRFDENGQRK